MRTPALVLTLTLAISIATPVRGDDTPPSVRYGDHRASARWLTLPTGMSVAVDQGVTWQGVTVYLALSNELVAVDAASGKVLWARTASAFWNEIGFALTPRTEGRGAWSVELRPDPRERGAADRREHYDLRTGEPVAAPLAEEPGAAVAVPRAWSGEDGRVTAPLLALATSAEQWERTAKLVFAGAPPVAARDVDWSREVVLVVAAGPSSNCRGFAIDSVRVTDALLRVRIHAHTFQSMGEGVPTNPWGVCVLPRRDLVTRVERNGQRYIGGPALWTTWIEWASLDAAATALAERLDTGARPAIPRQQVAPKRYY